MNRAALHGNSITNRTDFCLCGQISALINEITTENLSCSPYQGCKPQKKLKKPALSYWGVKWKRKWNFIFRANYIPKPQSIPFWYWIISRKTTYRSNTSHHIKMPNGEKLLQSLQNLQMMKATSPVLLLRQPDSNAGWLMFKLQSNIVKICVWETASVEIITLDRIISPFLCLFSLTLNSGEISPLFKKWFASKIFYKSAQTLQLPCASPYL